MSKPADKFVDPSRPSRGPGRGGDGGGGSRGGSGQGRSRDGSSSSRSSGHDHRTKREEGGQPASTPNRGQIYLPRHVATAADTRLEDGGSAPRTPGRGIPPPSRAQPATLPGTNLDSSRSPTQAFAIAIVNSHLQFSSTTHLALFAGKQKTEDSDPLRQHVTRLTDSTLEVSARLEAAASLLGCITQVASREASGARFSSTEIRGDMTGA